MRVERRLDRRPSRCRRRLIKLAQEEQIARRRPSCSLAHVARIERRPQPRCRRCRCRVPASRTSNPAFSSSTICLMRSRLSSRARGEHVAHDRQQLAGLVGHRLAAHEQPRRAVLRVAHRADRAAGADAAGRAADALRQRDEIFLGRAGLEQRPREQRQVGQQLRRAAAQVEAEIEIDRRRWSAARA